MILDNWFEFPTRTHKYIWRRNPVLNEVLKIFLIKDIIIVRFITVYYYAKNSPYEMFNLKDGIKRIQQTKSYFKSYISNLHE